MSRGAAALIATIALTPTIALAQGATPADSAAPAASIGAAHRPARAFSWPSFVAGFLVSIGSHEAAHLAASAVVGGSPGVGFNGGRPVVHSGIDAIAHPNRQFAFSASGMAVQLLINEAILGWPRPGGAVAGEFERGILAGGVGTVLFYFTLGRSSGVGDVYWMAASSGLSKWSLTAIFGGAAALEVVRIALDKRYAHFFAYPDPGGRLTFGLTLGGF